MIRNSLFYAKAKREIVCRSSGVGSGGFEIVGQFGQSCGRAGLSSVGEYAFVVAARLIRYMCYFKAGKRRDASRHFMHFV